MSIADFSDPRVGGGDSFCDRLNNRYTVYVLVLFSALITTKVKYFYYLNKTPELFFSPKYS